jgi:hypothetical protein
VSRATRVSVHAHAGRTPREAGRAAARIALGADVAIVNDPDGAPRLVGHDGFISISHDAPFVAIALADTPCGVDVCALVHEPRVRRVLAGLGIAAEPHPCVVFAAIEAALKLRREGAWHLFDRTVACELCEPVPGGGREGPASGGNFARVTGIGAPVAVAWELRDGYALAWAREPAS